jgi:hypothetical protein
MKTREPDKIDYLIACLIGMGGLVVYLRTLAPDVLYSDSAEFQTLSYTLGITHSTGYPIYILLGRLIGFLPINSPAWRINLLSAVCASITLAGVYLLARYFSRDRVGPFLGSMALGISYTFWAQAIIAEVYTPGMAFIVVIMVFLFHWHNSPTKRNGFLLAAALIAGAGVGVHASVWLIAPAAVAFVIWTLAVRRSTWSDWKHSLLAGILGAGIGVSLFVVTFLICDSLNPPSSFIRVMLYPSRIFWNLQPGDLKSPIQRMWLTISGIQWKDAMFPGGRIFLFDEAGKYGDRLMNLEFSPSLLILALAGLIFMLVNRPELGTFLPVYYVSSLYFILNYQPGDKYVFYLSTYIPLVVAAGTGMGFLLDLLYQRLIRLEHRKYLAIYLLPVLFFCTIIILPYGAERQRALKDGAATFVKEDYAYPIDDLRVPRFRAEMRLVTVPDNAVMVLDWQALYTTIYIAQVERKMNNMLFYEGMPHGNNGKIAETLIYELKNELLEGRLVYVENKYPGLEDDFRFTLSPANEMYRLEFK